MGTHEWTREDYKMTKPRIGYRWGKGSIQGNPTSWVINILSTQGDACEIVEAIESHELGYDTEEIPND